MRQRTLTTWLLGALAVVLCALAAPAAGAQPASAPPASAQPLEVRWDSLGPGEGRPSTQRFLFTIVAQPGADKAPFADTLFAVETGDLYRLAPGEAFFGPNLEQTGNPAPQEVYTITASGVHVTSGTGARGISYSTDGGVTWTIAEMTRDGVVDGSIVNGFFESATLGLLGAGQGGWLWQSRDEGRTWGILHDFEIGFSNSYAVRELAGDTRPGAARSPWAGRLVVGFRGPIRYSDDQGQTWTEVVMPVADDWHAIEEAPDGTLYLGGRWGTFLYASDDGGASWRQFEWFRPGAPIDVLENTPENLRFAVGPDGAVWVGLTALNGTREREGTFVYTRDGGRTWTEAAGGYGGYGVNDLAFDSAGRLVAATQVGAWRTAAPVVEVSAAPGGPAEGPGKPAEAALGVPYPNPALARGGGAVTVPLALGAAAEVTVAVYDVLGRQVAVLHDGPLAAGRHALAFETAGLPAGVYILRARSGGTEATRRVTVAR